MRNWPGSTRPDRPAVPRYADRRAAGRALAAELAGREWHDPVVLGLVRGGVPVAHEIAVVLAAELDIVVARKIGAPGHRELGVGAVTATGPAVYEPATLTALGLTAEGLAGACAAERAEARRREELYRGARPATALTGRDAILVDDGIATGVTAKAALRAVRERAPRRVVLVAPVCSPEAAQACEVELICPRRPSDFRAVGRWYRDFEQVTDDEVLALLGE